MVEWSDFQSQGEDKFPLGHVYKSYGHAIFPAVYTAFPLLSGVGIKYVPFCHHTGTLEPFLCRLPDNPYTKLC